MTIQQALQAAAATLQHSPTPDLDAELVLLHVLQQQESSWLHTRADEHLSPLHQTQFDAHIQERAAGKPVAYITGTAMFMGRPFSVSPDVLIPRSATEALVEQAVTYLNTLPIQSPRIADIGTGSGCVAISLALELPTAIIIATDIFPAALKQATHNATTYNVLDRIDFREGDMLSPLAGEELDLIVSNPPYVPSLEVTNANADPLTTGLTYEPQQALDGGPDGMQFVEVLKNANLPALVEGVHGTIHAFGMDR